MGKPLSFTLRIHRAVAESSMPSSARHLVHVLAVYANSATGTGWHSQATIARLTGLTDRWVRAIMADLETRTDWPVRLVRRHRGAAGGVGRSSDEWRLELTAEPELTSASDPPQPELTSASEGPRVKSRTGTVRHPNRKIVAPQPELTSGDLTERSHGVIDGSDSASQSSADFALSAPSVTVAAKRKTKAAPEGFQDVIDAWSREFERVRGAKPVVGSRNGKAAKVLLAAMPRDEVIAVIRRAFADEWFAQNQGELHHIAGSPNQWRGKGAPRRGNAPVQPSYGVVDPSAYGGGE